MNNTLLRLPAAGPTARPAQRGAFTLVELLVVIGIIGLLVAILVPVISSVRTHAYSLATNNEIQQIVAAIDGYYMDNKAYPGPMPETSLIDSNGYSPSLPVTASQNMILGLLGGINPPTSPGGAPTFLPAQVGLGPMTLLPSSSSGTGYYATRHNPYGQNLTQFLYPQTSTDKYSTGSVTGTSGGTQCTLDFVDRFPIRGAYYAPILYLRANAGVRPTSTSPQQGSAAIASSDDGWPAQYDNKQLKAYGGAYPELLGGAPPGPSSNSKLARQDYQSWDAYFQDQSYLGSKPVSGWAYTPGAPAAHIDTYILIAAGPDGVFGTADDIRN